LNYVELEANAWPRTDWVNVELTKLTTVRSIIIVLEEDVLNSVAGALGARIRIGDNPDPTQNKVCGN
jgi:hypothetical protein